MTPDDYGIGVRQKDLLNKMIRYGGGVYLPRWRLNYSTRQLLESLEKRKLVEQVDHYEGDTRHTVYRVVIERSGW